MPCVWVFLRTGWVASLLPCNVLQRAAFKCSYDCTDNASFTAQEARHCIEGCNGNMDVVNKHIQSQMQTFQVRVSCRSRQAGAACV